MVIRTRLVELSSLEAVAYRQKLRGGQSGVVILRPDTAQPGLALLNHQSGRPGAGRGTLQRRSGHGEQRRLPGDREGLHQQEG